MFEEERARIEAAVPSRRYFRKFGPHGERTHQIHLVERTDRGWWDRHLAFRDYLRAQSETAREYGRLKLDLAARFRDDCAGYMDAKAELVGSIERRALDARSSG
ncbi:MAG: GrpB family protein [Rubrobacter sp.]|nr:GrpB family protein [Rubrobacter sp.]